MSAVKTLPLGARRTCFECGVALALLVESEHPGTCQACVERMAVRGTCGRCGRIVTAQERPREICWPAPNWCWRCLAQNLRAKLTRLWEEYDEALDLHDLEDADGLYLRARDVERALDAVRAHEFRRAATHLEDLRLW